MYIACPECDTKFVVTPEQIGKHGRKVKCSKCSHVWHQKLEDNIRIEPVLTVPEAAIPLGNGINLPALLPIKIPPYLFAMPVLMVGLIIFMLAMLFPNKLGADSLLNSNEVSIKSMQIVHEKDIDKITVNYKVHNASLKDIKMPLVRIRLFDKNNRVLKSRIDDRTNIDMSPDQLIQVKTEFVPAPPSVDSIDIMIGNKIDFLLR
ncbi:MAG: zinc-ribbon domain-containing protein [Rickettsiaceae bacterium]|nr:zinc-ribbon domain-containing protein [Rickettsiaceae bacterium]MDP4832837.1 zinc-ribbon domain-containing protein [Rickettsiaceae bacterium]MDP5021120.1 zinc-ribbon domain-containing protein [Rickettsiaceae bacterium]MDP5082731.1 zinc-ribbon domain-containing protein [Rickettsiaceae bacterium]